LRYNKRKIYKAQKAEKRMANTEAKIKGLGEILRENAPFDEALKKIGKNNVISARDLAYAIISEGSKSSLSTDGSYTKHADLYAKNQSPLVIMDSPLLNYDLAKQATDENRSNRYFELKDKKLCEKYLRQSEKDKKAEPEKRNVLILPSRKNFTISPGENWDVARGIFKDQAESYFKFLGKNGIDSITFYTISPETVDNSKNPILTELWLYRLGDSDRSDLDGYGRDLDYSGRVRGVRKSSAEGALNRAPRSGAVPKISLPYSSREVEKYSRIISGVKEGNLPASKLEKVLGFLGKLKQ
jgi:hypothetical protein